MMYGLLNHLGIQVLVVALMGAALLPTGSAAPLKCLKNGQVFYADEVCPSDYQALGRIERPALQAGDDERQQAKQRAAVEKQRLPKELEMLEAESATRATNSKSKAKPRSKSGQNIDKAAASKPQKKSRSKKTAAPKVFKAKALD